MDQIKVVLSGAGDKVTSVASDASNKLASVTGDKKNVVKSDAATSESPSDVVMSTCPSLTRQQRMIGFVSCFVLGYIVSFGVLALYTIFGSKRECKVSSLVLLLLLCQSTFALMLGSDNGAKFGVTYSLGNIISLCGSAFLVGPKQQAKLMFKPVRRIATIIYLVMIVIVLIVAFAAPQLGLVILLLVIIQCVAAVWYGNVQELSMKYKSVDSFCHLFLSKGIRPAIFHTDARCWQVSPRNFVELLSKLAKK
ncbi:hypothetical protein PsorP6_015666 [Peronosclerospora sorghi]|uniref:Uncharacterized protein n=1 Tax=Peronosclerospora sorghi TaxID=230839 RepID=A0ACC0WP43_9STRA|nr:hypothetical protein PsorP6_015666 [Peronosclerospora sorghi]